MQFEPIADEEIGTVAGGIDWNQVGMQAFAGAGAGAAVAWGTGTVAIPVYGQIAAAGLVAGGAAVGAGLAIWSSWNQPTMKPAPAK